MKKSVLLVALITILVISYTSASAQVASMSSLALRLAQGAAQAPSGAAMLTSGGIVATAAAKVHVSIIPAFAQPSQEMSTTLATPFSVEVTEATTEASMAEELNVFISQERALKQRSWFRKKK